MVGWKLKTDLVEHDDFDLDRMYERAPDEFIYDGMCGDYLIFGKIVYFSDRDKEDEFTTLELADLVLSDQDILDLEELFREVTFGMELYDWVETNTKPSLLTFTHFS